MSIRSKSTFIFITLFVIISITLLQITTAELPKDFGKSHNSNKPSIPFGTMLKDKDSDSGVTMIGETLNREFWGIMIGALFVRMKSLRLIVNGFYASQKIE
ncbi:27642_t:CDS:2 [Dentiscutata erythropus]|uniref:27642_t:CDS:1 n=1 Tax=Dentiscutata erythropus TaxID=1348616 RepID=A0A9N9BAP5_9GLOM|nr:27642_t:CDS:2 [Dentiscutata erythropus]